MGAGARHPPFRRLTMATARGRRKRRPRRPLAQRVGLGHRERGRQERDERLVGAGAVREECKLDQLLLVELLGGLQREGDAAADHERLVADRDCGAAGIEQKFRVPAPLRRTAPRRRSRVSRSRAMPPQLLQPTWRVCGGHMLGATAAGTSHSCEDVGHRHQKALKRLDLEAQKDEFCSHLRQILAELGGGSAKRPVP